MRTRKNIKELLKDYLVSVCGYDEWFLDGVKSEDDLMDLLDDYKAFIEYVNEPVFTSEDILLSYN